MTGKNIKYSNSYEYIMFDDSNIGVVGISKEASDKLGDICLVDLPKVGKTYKKDQEVGTIESVKVASDIFNPVDGEVIEINEKLKTFPELISKDPLGEGWIYKIKIADTNDLNKLMDFEDFKKNVGEH